MPSPPVNPDFTLPSDFGGDTSAIEALGRGQLSRLGTPMLALVKAVRSGGASLVGTVDVQPMVHQQDALSRPVPHGIIHNVPYLRVQGGASALIIDPKPGDIGFIIISGRDHSNAVAAKAPAAAASFRMFDMSDCVYVGGFLNNAPNQYIYFTDTGIRIVTPGTVEIEAASIHATCDITTDGDVKAGSISLKTHTHGGVQPGSGTTGGPL